MYSDKEERLFVKIVLIEKLREKFSPFTNVSCYANKPYIKSNHVQKRQSFIYFTFLLVCVEKSYNSIFSPFVEMNAYWLSA